MIDRVPVGAERLEAYYEMGLNDPEAPADRDYRVPDCAVVDARHLSDRGIEGAAHLVVEVLSPRDDSEKKLPFYARVGVREVWLVDPAARTVEVHVCSRDGTTAVQPLEAGRIVAPALGLELVPMGHELRIHHREAVHVVARAPRER